MWISVALMGDSSAMCGLRVSPVEEWGTSCSQVRESQVQNPDTKTFQPCALEQIISAL